MKTYHSLWNRRTTVTDSSSSWNASSTTEVQLLNDRHYDENTNRNNSDPQPNHHKAHYNDDANHTDDGDNDNIMNATKQRNYSSWVNFAKISTIRSIIYVITVCCIFWSCYVSNDNDRRRRRNDNIRDDDARRGRKILSPRKRNRFHLWKSSQESEQLENWMKQQENEKMVASIFQNRDHIVSLQDLPDLVTDLGWDIPQYMYGNHTKDHNASDYRQPKIVTEENIHEFDSKKYKVWNSIHRAGLKIDEYVYNVLPNWDAVRNLYYTKYNQQGNDPNENPNTDHVNNIPNENMQSENNIFVQQQTFDSNNNNDNNRNEDDTNDRPVIIGMETCRIFRDRVPINERFIGVAGQMNTGTNALAALLSSNIYIPNQNPRYDDSNNHRRRRDRNSNYRSSKRRHNNNNDRNRNSPHDPKIMNKSDTNNSNENYYGGILSTVPWHKHGWISLRYQYHYQEPNEHKNVLPIVIIRDPYFWMNSMCQSPYTLLWNMTYRHCPNLIESMKDINNTKKSVHVTMTWGRSFIRTYLSLVHLWSSWYREYYEVGNVERYNHHMIQRMDQGPNSAASRQSDNAKHGDQIIPRLMIRFEDMLFYPELVVNEIRRCVGAKWIHDTNSSSSYRNNRETSIPAGNDKDNDEDDNDSYDYYANFVYTSSPSKTHPYFSRFKQYQSSFVSALIKYGSDNTIGGGSHRKVDDMPNSLPTPSPPSRTRRVRNMTDADIAFAVQYLDSTLLQAFQYNHPRL